MSDLLRMTGMYSGMDTESIVSQLVKTKSTKVTNLKNEQKKLEWKQTAWQDLNSKIYNMYSKTLSNLRLTSAYSKKSTVSSILQGNSSCQRRCSKWNTDITGKQAC